MLNLQTYLFLNNNNICQIVSQFIFLIIFFLFWPCAVHSASYNQSLAAYINNNIQCRSDSNEFENACWQMKRCCSLRSITAAVSFKFSFTKPVKATIGDSCSSWTTATTSRHTPAIKLIISQFNSFRSINNIHSITALLMPNKKNPKKNNCQKTTYNINLLSRGAHSIFLLMKVKLSSCHLISDSVLCMSRLSSRGGRFCALSFCRNRGGFSAMYTYTNYAAGISNVLLQWEKSISYFTPIYDLLCHSLNNTLHNKYQFRHHWSILMYHF